MAEDPKTTENKESEQEKICGIVMPISDSGDGYSEDYWLRVRRILQKAIEKAGLEWKVVWEHADSQIIQGKILQNLYTNQVVICDLSTLNPNVMFETGLRLTTSLPTIIVTDDKTKMAFDLGSFTHITYPHNLEYEKIVGFIDTLSDKIKVDFAQFQEGTYKPFTKNYSVTVPEITTESVPADELILEKITEISERLERIEKKEEQGSKWKKAERETLPYSERELYFDLENPGSVPPDEIFQKIRNGNLSDIRLKSLGYSGSGKILNLRVTVNNPHLNKEDIKKRILNLIDNSND